MDGNPITADGVQRRKFVTLFVKATSSPAEVACTEQAAVAPTTEGVVAAAARDLQRPLGLLLALAAAMWLGMDGSLAAGAYNTTCLVICANNNMTGKAVLRAVVLIALPLVLYASLQALKQQPVVPRGHQPRVLWSLQLLSARVVAVMFDSLLGMQCLVSCVCAGRDAGLQTCQGRCPYTVAWDEGHPSTVCHSAVGKCRAGAGAAGGLSNPTGSGGDHRS